MKKNVKIPAFILTLLMLISVMPLSLFAEEAVSQSEDQTARTPLEILESKHTGELYTMPTVTGSSLASKLEEGYWSQNGTLSSTEEGAGYVIKDTAANFSHQYTARYDNKVGSSGCYVFSVTVKRSEAMPDGFMIANSQFVSNFVIWQALLEGDSIKIKGSKTGTGSAAFSTSIYTTFTFAYDNTTGNLLCYANGVLFDTVGSWGTASIHGCKAITASCSGAVAGEAMTLLKTSLYTLYTTNFDAFAVNKNPANGVFEIDGNYYFFENGLPVLGKVLSYEGYTIVTEADSGIITKCIMTQDNSDLYQRWTAADYKNAGIDLVYCDYTKSYSAPVDGYVYREVTEGDETYYLIDPVKTNVRQYYITGTDVGDGYEFTAKNASSALYYKSIPADAVAVTDEDGNTVAYKSASAPTGTITLDLTYYHEFNNYTQFTSDPANINIRLKVGDTFYDTEGTTNFVRFRYYVNGEGGTNYEGRYDFLPGKIVVEDNVPYLYMGDVNCGILRSDVYTDLTLRTYISDGNYVYDLYVGGVLTAEKLLIKEGVTSYKAAMIGTYLSSNASLVYKAPFVTWGETQFYYGDKVNSLENGFNGDKMSASGVYTYENGIAVSLTKGVSANSTVGLKGYSVSLGENLGLNFYASLPENAKEAVINVGNDTQRVDLTNISAEANGFFKICAKVSSINVAEDVFVTFYDENGDVMPIYGSDGAVYEASYTASVKKYASSIIEKKNIYGYETVELVKAMLNYAAYAENYFGKNTSLSTAYSAKDAAAVTALDAATITGTVYADSENAQETLGSIQLILENTTLIRINLTGPCEFSTDCKNVCYVEEDGKYYVYVCAIDAKNLDTVYTFYVNGIKVSISVTGVAKVVTSSNAYSESFVNLMKAIYLYSAAANALA
ncbi:MAG: hypothetical protein IKB38_07440 [Clostridia bacterium]|nr:hypothetical protein [Clostridia bacterium]